MDLVVRLPSREPGDVTLAEVERCARPIHFESDDPAFLYYGSGSGFFAVLENHWLLFSAAHVVRDGNPRKLSVLPTDGSQRWVRADAQVHVRPVDPKDSDVADVKCFRIDKNALRIAAGETMLGVNLECSTRSLVPGQPLLIAGYPQATRGAEYDERCIRAIGQRIWGRYRGPSVSVRCHEVELSDLGGLDDLDGFSGSPVFTIEDQQDDLATLRLAGMMLRATASSRTGHFVEAAVLLKVAREAIRVPVRRRDEQFLGPAAAVLVAGRGGHAARGPSAPPRLR